jgi:acetyl-CoA carboxylase biotin carboxyl carrier protein
LSQRKSKSKAQAGGGSAAASSSRGEDSDAGPMSVGFLQQLVSLMAANDLSVVDLREGERRIRLQRGGAAASGQQYLLAGPPVHAPAPATIPATTGPSQLPPVARDDDAGLIAIKSPMVGTFYAASSPDAKPFVTVGSVVDEETDVCIIEAMKVFNNIKAECRGTIEKIMVTNGQTVEFGTVLFLVKFA